MNHDDNTPTPAFGVPTVRPGVAIGDASLDKSAEAIDPDLGIPVRDVNLFDAYSHELARMAAEDPRPDTPEEQADVERLYAMSLDAHTKTREQLLEERRLRRRTTSR